MTQNRNPPAYQEYAASMLASKEFRLMTLEQRSFLYTLKLECWENKQAPVSSRDLAKYIGFDIAEIEKALTDNVKTAFVEENGWFSCPELDNYRQHLEERNSKQSEGGKRSAGQKLAKEAAESVAGKVSIPAFRNNETGTDFNDRWCLDNPEVTL